MLKAITDSSGVLYYEYITGVTIYHYVTLEKYCTYMQKRKRVPNSVFKCENIQEIDMIFRNKYKGITPKKEDINKEQSINQEG